VKTGKRKLESQNVLQWAMAQPHRPHVNPACLSKRQMAKFYARSIRRPPPENKNKKKGNTSAGRKGEGKKYYGRKK
jgi:hypothetical protein